MGIGTLELTVAVAPGDDALRRLVDEVAAATDRPARPLHLAALLELPRLAGRAGTVDASTAHALLRALADELPPAAAWLGPPAEHPRELAFAPVADLDAAALTRRFHYLRSPRLDGEAYGLVDPGSGAIAALCVVAPLDVTHVAERLAARGADPRRARVVARVFAFAGAPRNSLSYLLARVGAVEAERGTAALVTYVNPNMGFTGASYLASGWSPLGEEPGTTYRYLDDRYVTDRALRASHGQRDDAGYAAALGTRFAVSTMPLAPLQLLQRHLGRRTTSSRAAPRRGREPDGAGRDPR